MISQEAINEFSCGVLNVSMRFTPKLMNRDKNDMARAIAIKHFYAPVVHPITGKTISKYPTLAKDPATREIWTSAWGKEWNSMAQGDKKTGETGTNSILILE